jgi:NADH-quinone oxidoreductase subunit L
VHGAHALNDFLAPIFATSKAVMENTGRVHEVSHSTEWILTGVSTVAILITVIFAWKKFSAKPDTQEAEGFGKVLANKWYVDEAYNKVVVNPLNKLGGFFNSVIELKVIDGLVNGVGRLVNYGSRQLRFLQSGQVGSYVFLMVLGMLLIFIVQFFLRK